MSCFVNMDGDPVFTGLDGQQFTPSFVAHTRAPNAMTDALVKARTEGDETALIEWLSDNDPLYAEVEDVATEADEADRAEEFNRLADWMDEYRRCLIACEPVPPSPLPATTPIPEPKVRPAKPKAEPTPPAPVPTKPALYVPDPNPQPFKVRLQLELFAGNP